MKKLLPILTVLFMAACSKQDLNPLHHEITWRFVFYDSNSRVVDSSAELHFPDSGAVTMQGPGVISTIPPIAPYDTVEWPELARLFLITGPRNLSSGGYNLQVPNGGCAFNIFLTTPILDRTGWMLQRTENGKRIDMFAQIQNGGYDGKYNDFPYAEYIDGAYYPWVGELDNANDNWVCGSTQGSCQMAPQLLSY